MQGALLCTRVFLKKFNRQKFFFSFGKMFKNGKFENVPPT